MQALVFRGQVIAVGAEAESTYRALRPEDAMLVDCQEGTTPKNSVWTKELGVHVRPGWRSMLVARAKRAAGDVIADRLPDWKQLNMISRSVELLDKGAGRTAGENKEKGDIAAIWAWVKAVRARSDEIEAAIMAAKSDIDAEAVLAAAQWPAWNG